MHTDLPRFCKHKRCGKPFSMLSPADMTISRSSCLQHFSSSGCTPAAPPALLAFGCECRLQQPWFTNKQRLTVKYTAADGTVVVILKTDTRAISGFSHTNETGYAVYGTTSSREAIPMATGRMSTLRDTFFDTLASDAELLVIFKAIAGGQRAYTMSELSQAQVDR